MNDTNEMTLAEVQEKHGLTAAEVNGLLKSLVKLELIKVVDKRPPKGGGKGRKSLVYAIPKEITLSL